MLSTAFGFLAAAGTCLAAPTLNSLRDTAAPVVSVKNGSYSGLYNSAYHQDRFLGIPYAQPPVGDLRFRVAESLNSTWQDVRLAEAYTPFCVGYGGDNIGKEMSEDCLYLSVVRPSGVDASAQLPVAAWIHGGGLFMGGSNDARYDPTFIVQNSVEMGTPMVAVSIQYRLSAWGFLGGKEVLDAGVTNLGFRDQRLALHWIQENIAAFGGSPSEVTIWGESAGGQSVGAQLLAYNGRDDKLFKGAIAQSGGPASIFFHNYYPGGYNSTAYDAIYGQLVRNTSCASSSAPLSCLRALPYAELNGALNTSASRGFGPFSPMMDGDFIAEYPSKQLEAGRFVKVPLLIGANTDEGTAFNPGPVVRNDTAFLKAVEATHLPPQVANIIAKLYPNLPRFGIPSFATWPYNPDSAMAKSLGSQVRRMQAYFGDVVEHSPRRGANVAWAEHGVPSYSYRFDVTVNGVPNYIGATHFQEVAFVYNNTQGHGYATNPFGNLTAEETQRFGRLAREMSRGWVGFIVGGEPRSGVEGGVEWPVYEGRRWRWRGGRKGGEGWGGRAEGRNIVFSVNGTGSYVERDSYRSEGMRFIRENLLAVYGV
ncbi:Alpha/Beta hydrolase protein [Amylocarpus encephaloides]|uniref:Carboxylic ester hydrolase n=1 Tax=Amylocarpus encephaloides TaxID=45428 RepID=A0A9P7YMJ8_9HELO|nr:Alpha/Beta hydrolase protein [Amylocarpus encephaloides]